MKHLFPNRFKKKSGLAFYLSLLIGLYLFLTEKFDDLLIIKVPQFFSSQSTITVSGTENIIGNKNIVWVENGFLDEILTIIIIISGIINSFSKENIEDELISKLRLESLTLSLYINYTVILVSNLLMYDFVYFNILVFNLFTILLFFNLIFKYKLFKHYRS